MSLFLSECLQWYLKNLYSLLQDLLVPSAYHLGVWPVRVATSIGRCYSLGRCKATPLFVLWFIFHTYFWLYVHVHVQAHAGTIETWLGHCLQSLIQRSISWISHRRYFGTLNLPLSLLLSGSRSSPYRRIVGLRLPRVLPLHTPGKPTCTAPAYHWTYDLRLLALFLFNALARVWCEPVHERVEGIVRALMFRSREWRLAQSCWSFRRRRFQDTSWGPLALEMEPSGN
jgi:hypothetical protein